MWASMLRTIVQVVFFSKDSRSYNQMALSTVLTEPPAVDAHKKKNTTLKRLAKITLTPQAAPPFKDP